ncbi:Bcr/CflA family efflux MFS transporter [Pseudosulfitobacter sp. SM2401]|uniref:multidrug effflux MFS transporter n=1 Tax=Pseudosulfitobacter sp. SM2401 TaxID=3350098 RepID=UPI0036F2BEB8
MQNKPVIRFLDRSTPPHIFTLIFMAGMSAMVMNMFLPSLPQMSTFFGVDDGVMALSVPLFLFVSAILQIFIGPVSDRMGRRPVLLVGIAIFMLATIGCILATNITVFLIFRMIQAAIAVCMVLSRAVIRDSFDQEQSASMIAYVTMGMAVVPMISPAIGGFLDELFGWKANFWAFFFVGGALFALVWRDLGETVKPSGLTLTQQFKEYPELLRSPRFWGYCMASALSSGAFFAYLGGGPFVGSVVFGMSPKWVGVFFGAPAVGYFAGNWITGRNAKRLGVNKLILWGAIAVSCGTALMLGLFLIGFGSPLTFFGLMTCVGLGNGMVIPNATAGMLSVRPHLAGTASGLGGAIMIGGGAGLASLAVFLLKPETGAYPLILIMMFTSMAAVVAILGVYRREARIKASGN